MLPPSCSSEKSPDYKIRKTVNSTSGTRQSWDSWTTMMIRTTLPRFVGERKCALEEQVIQQTLRREFQLEYILRSSIVDPTRIRIRYLNKKCNAEVLSVPEGAVAIMRYR